jgi:hypothetical protein
MVRETGGFGLPLKIKGVMNIVKACVGRAGDNQYGIARAQAGNY